MVEQTFDDCGENFDPLWITPEEYFNDINETDLKNEIMLLNENAMHTIVSCHLGLVGSGYETPCPNYLHVGGVSNHMIFDTSLLVIRQRRRQLRLCLRLRR